MENKKPTPETPKPEQPRKFWNAFGSKKARVLRGGEYYRPLGKTPSRRDVRRIEASQNILDAKMKIHKLKSCNPHSQR